MIVLRRVSGFVVLAALAVSGAAFAQYPDRPIKLIVPYQPGGGVDTVARVIAPRLSEAFKQPVVIENRAGAGGVVGMLAMTRSNPDGYTFAMSAMGMAIVPWTTRSMPFDPTRALAPVAQVVSMPMVIAVGRNLAARNIAELVEHARNNPGRLNVATSGQGSVELFRLSTDTKVTSIRFSGMGPAAASVLRGDTDFIISDTPSVKGYVKGGGLRILAVVSANRLPELPHVPTARESGWPDYVMENWFGAFLPAGTPANIVRALNTGINRAAMQPAVVQALKPFDATPVNNTPEEFAAFYHRQLELWRDVFKRSGFVPE